MPTLRPTLEPSLICLGDEPPTINIDFTYATVVYSNLGGNYDDVDPEETYYREVATLNGNRVNLRITTEDDTYNCVGEACSWVKNGMLGQVAMRGTSTLTIKLDFVYDDDTPVALEVLYLTFLDLDGENPGLEIVKLHGIESYITHPNTFLTLTSGVDNGVDWVQASNYVEPNVDNPTDINSLSEDQQKVAIVGKWLNVNSVQITLSVTTWPNTNRFVLFGGTSDSLLNLCKVCASSEQCSEYEKPGLMCYYGETDNCDSDICTCTVNLATDLTCEAEVVYTPSRCAGPITSVGRLSLEDCMEAAREAGTQYFMYRSDNQKCQIPEDAANAFTQCVTNRINIKNAAWGVYRISCECPSSCLESMDCSSEECSFCSMCAPTQDPTISCPSWCANDSQQFPDVCNREKCASCDMCADI